MKLTLDIERFKFIISANKPEQTARLEISAKERAEIYLIGIRDNELAVYIGHSFKCIINCIGDRQLVYMNIVRIYKIVLVPMRLSRLLIIC